ncbi:hypothetical protein [Wolbachia endosymbiont (group A) of Icerya purchasi]|uniref:hypothetical protein n=1 Tax=Wolbachia endosymbiont (group A) of Icerya purchasi TaxID=2954019 RepID=UPI0022323E36|nr:hypothetical protein [Wolbachia endosymbiont (group A) of Icerya purchasi]
MDDDTKDFLMLCGAASVIGALTGLGLSFTALSPLVVGGIVGSIVPACLAVSCIVDSLYKFFKKDPIEKARLISWSITTPVSSAIGVGLAASATAIFPGAMLDAALAGATIGVIALVAGTLVVGAISLAAEKVNEYIISPIIEHFSSKGEEYESPKTN